MIYATLETIEGYDAYRCPCGGTGKDNDPTLWDNATPGVRDRACPHCKGLKAVYVLKGFSPPRYAGPKIEVLS